MEAEMPRSQVFSGLDSGRRVGSKVSGGFVELELVDLVGSPVGYVRYEGEAVGRIGLNGVGA